MLIYWRVICTGNYTSEQTTSGVFERLRRALKRIPWCTALLHCAMPAVGLTSPPQCSQCTFLFNSMRRQTIAKMHVHISCTNHRPSIKITIILIIVRSQKTWRRHGDYIRWRNNGLIWFLFHATYITASPRSNFWTWYTWGLVNKAQTC